MTAAVGTQRFGRKLGTIAGLGIIGTGVGALLQMLLPAVLLRVWSDENYAAAIAVQGICAYVAVADAGIQATLLHRLSVLVANGEEEEARRIASSGFRALVLLSALATAVVVVVALASTRILQARFATISSNRPSMLVLAVALQAIAMASGVSLGGWSTAVEYAQKRYVRAQVLGLIRTFASTSTLLALALMRRSATTALMGAAVSAIVVDVTRFYASAGFLRPTNTASRTGLKSFLWSARGGPLYALSLASTNGLLPAALGVVAPASAAAAVPGRTAANAARLVAMAVGNSIWVPLAARTAELKDDPAARRNLWWRVGTVLAALQSAAVGSIVLVAELLIPLWVPTKARSIMASLPLFLVEQAVWVAIGPAQVLLLSAGRFGQIGGLSLVASTIALGLMLVLLPSYGATALAIGLACSSVLITLPGYLYLERRYWIDDGTTVPRRRERLHLTAIAASAVLSMAIGPWVARLAALCAVALSAYLLVANLRLLRPSSSAPSNT